MSTLPDSPCLKLRLAESEGVGDYGDGAEAHGGAGEHGAEEPADDGVEDAGGDGYAQRVVEKSEGEILADIADGGAAQAAGAHDSAEIAFDQGDAGAFDGDVGAGAHGYADIGGGERGSIVDAVASHGYDATLLAETL